MAVAVERRDAMAWHITRRSAFTATTTLHRLPLLQSIQNLLFMLMFRLACSTDG